MKSRNGFATTIIILIVLALAVIGGIVYIHYVYLPHMTAQNQTSPNTTSTWIQVPGDSTFGTSDFSVMAYEVRCLSNSSNQPLITSDFEGSGYHDSTQPCTGTDRHIASVATGYPITNVGHDEAINYCQSIGAHLITNQEWMTIADNVAKQPENWTGGSVGTGMLFSGVSSPRNLTLSNGSVIWDMAYTQQIQSDANDTRTPISASKCSSSGSLGWCEFAKGAGTNPYITSWAPGISATQFAPPNSEWNSTQGVGLINVDTFNDGIFFRGGGNGSQVGIFTVDFSHGGSSSAYGGNVGFRCVQG